MQQFLQNLLYAVITAAVPVLATYAGSALKQVAKKKAAETENVKVAGYLREIGDAVSDAVAATSQTYVDELKKARSFDKDAHSKAADQALVAAMQAIQPATMRFIESAFGSARLYLQAKIEAEVRKQKNELAETLPFVGELATTVETMVEETND